MKVYTEGLRSIIYYIGFCEDMVRISHNPDERIRYQGLIDVLIPIAKGYVSDRAFDVCSIGVQIFGGYGYTREYPQEQLLRDCKITQIYEGTNGIQAMDLLGRKLGLNKGQSFKNLREKMIRTANDAKSLGPLSEPAKTMENLIGQFQETALKMVNIVRSEKMMNAYAFAYPFMEVTGDTVTAWMLLWRAIVAVRKIEAGAKKRDLSFYEGQIKSVCFFMNVIIPVTLGKINAILRQDGSMVDISEDSFGGK